MSCEETPNIGTWTVGEQIKGLIYQVTKNDGTARDLTGTTVAKLKGAHVGEPEDTIDITGAIPTPANGKIVFPSLARAIAPKRRETFEVRVEITQGGLLGRSEPFRFTVAAFP
jgi:hypothetical protein